jgi:hypothetical protein
MQESTHTPERFDVVIAMNVVQVCSSKLGWFTDLLLSHTNIDVVQ